MFFFLVCIPLCCKKPTIVPTYKQDDKSSIRISPFSGFDFENVLKIDSFLRFLWSDYSAEWNVVKQTRHRCERMLNTSRNMQKHCQESTFVNFYFEIFDGLRSGDVFFFLFFHIFPLWTWVQLLLTVWLKSQAAGSHTQTLLIGSAVLLFGLNHTRRFFPSCENFFFLFLNVCKIFTVHVIPLCLLFYFMFCKKKEKKPNKSLMKKKFFCFFWCSGGRVRASRGVE